MISVKATLDNWSAWAPGYETRQSWQQWQGLTDHILDQGSPDVKFLPAMFRRRLSRLSKLALSAAFECLPQDEHVPTVFASRHGELSTSVTLLEDLAHNTGLSPTKFSTSVHNTASGMYSIANHDQSASTAIAAGIDSLEMGFIEAACQLTTNKHSKVMLILSEEPIHHHYQQYSDMPEKAFAVALLLSNSAKGTKISLTSDSATTSPATHQHGLSLIKLLTGNEKELTTQGQRLAWNWSCQFE